MNFRKLALIFCLIILLGGWSIQAQEPSTIPGVKPFIMPVSGKPGPSTWLIGQPYGNTTGAYTNGASNYSAGQYLHFGIDISMPCGTPLVAVADGIVDSVDSLSRGSAPHNLLLRFPDLNLVVLYGHLLKRPALQRNQEVRQGEFVALSGEPSSNCDSRPHLHFEVRSLDYKTAYNPIRFIKAPWHSLVGMGSFFRPLFQRDLTNSRRWVSLEDQPDVRFGGPRLNNYTKTLPPAFIRRESMNAPLDRPFTAINETWTARQLGVEGCCAGAWWHPVDDELLFFIDGLPGELASLYEIRINGSTTPRLLQNAPPPILSSDGTYELIYERDQVIVHELATRTEWIVRVPDSNPTLSPDNRMILWAEGNNFRKIWVRSLDGTVSKTVWSSQGRSTSARWLDADRLLLSEREPGPGRFTSLYVANIHDETSYPLGTWQNPRTLQVSPGGKRLIFYSAFNTDRADDGMYAVEIAPGAAAQKLPWFGDYRWRDNESVFYITFDPATDIQRLNYYHVPDGSMITLTDPGTTPFTIANGDWAVSPNGNSIVYQEGQDNNLWLLEADVTVSDKPTANQKR